MKERKNILHSWNGNTYEDMKLLENGILREQKGVGGLEDMESRARLKNGPVSSCQEPRNTWKTPELQ